MSQSQDNKVTADTVIYGKVTLAVHNTQREMPSLNFVLCALFLKQVHPNNENILLIILSQKV